MEVKLMAWLLERDATPYATVNFAMVPSCLELDPPVEFYDENGIRHLYGRLTRSAIDIPDRFWPKRARLKTARKSIPDLVGFCAFWGLSGAFRDRVEELEPGIHEFRRVEVLRQDGTPIDDAYYAVNIRKLVQGAIDWERTDVPSEEFHQGRQLVGLHNFENRNIVMSRAAVSGIHLWISNDKVGGVIGVSDVLFHKLKSDNLLTGVIPFHAVEI